MIVQKNMTNGLQNVLRGVHDLASAMAVCGSPGQVYFMSMSIHSILEATETMIKELPGVIYMKNNPQTNTIAGSIRNKLKTMPTQDLSEPARQFNQLSIQILEGIQEKSKR